MSNKIVHLSDTLATRDSLSINSGNADNLGFPTEIIIRSHNCKRDGEHTIEVVHNKTCLPGRLKLIEDNFPIDINFGQHLYLNDNVLGTYDPVTGSDLNPITLNPGGKRPKDDNLLYHRRNTQWWCAGDGARNRTVANSAYESHATDTKLFHMIPFRFIPINDALPEEERRNYKFEVVFPKNSDYYGYKGYYFKKINFNMSNDYNGIHMEVDGEDYTPRLSWADTVPDLDADESASYRVNQFKGGRVQHNFIDMGLDINSKEFKEWFEFIDGTKSNASISEIGLVCGLECVNGHGTQPIADLSEDKKESLSLYSEIYDAEVFAHLSFEPYTVARENARIDFEYRIYS